jgi:hypothetical protein
MALLRIPFGSACPNDALEERYFPNFDGVLVKRGFAATGVADDDGAHENRCRNREPCDLFALDEYRGRGLRVGRTISERTGVSPPERGRVFGSANGRCPRSPARTGRADFGRSR